MSPSGTTQQGTRSILTSIEEVQAAALQVAKSATRLLTVHTQDLDPPVLDQPEFIETVKRLVLTSGYAKVRVLLADPSRTQYESSRFIGLARKITSFIEIRHAHPDFRGHRASFLIADDRAIVYRADATRWEGVHESNDRAVARHYLSLFDQAWLGSAPHPETRQLHL